MQLYACIHWHTGAGFRKPILKENVRSGRVVQSMSQIQLFGKKNIDDAVASWRSHMSTFSSPPVKSTPSPQQTACFSASKRRQWMCARQTTKNLQILKVSLKDLTKHKTISQHSLQVQMNLDFHCLELVASCRRFSQGWSCHVYSRVKCGNLDSPRIPIGATWLILQWRCHAVACDPVRGEGTGAAFSTCHDDECLEASCWKETCLQDMQKSFWYFSESDVAKNHWSLRTWVDGQLHHEGLELERMTNWTAKRLKGPNPNVVFGLVNCEEPRCLHWTHNALQKIQGLSVEWQVCGSRQSVKPCPNPSHHVLVNQNHCFILLCFHRSWHATCKTFHKFMNVHGNVLKRTMKTLGPASAHVLDGNTSLYLCIFVSLYLCIFVSVDVFVHTWSVLFPW